MKKKLCASVLSLAMVASLLAGCGSTASTETTKDAAGATEAAAEEKAEEAVAEPAADANDTGADFTGEDPQLEKNLHILSIWAEDNDNGVLITKICEDYKKVNPNFTYEYELVSSDDLRQKVSTLVASNDLPDMFVYESGKPIVELIEAGKVVNVTSALEEVGSYDYLSPAASRWRCAI